MKKLFSFLLLGLLCSIGTSWATDYYTPSSDEVIILNNIVTSSGTFSSHSAITWGAKPSSNSKKAGDPNNNGEATSSNVPCYSIKNNGGAKQITLYVAGCSKVILYHENHSSRYPMLILTPSEGAGSTLSGAASKYFNEFELDPNKSYTIALQGTGSGTDQQDLYIYAVKLIKGETCAQPASALALSSDAAEIVYVGDEITFSTNGGNGGEVTIEGAASETISENKWIATVGEHTFTASQAEITIEEVLYCEQVSEELIINVLEKTPVTSCAISGNAAAYKGFDVTYNATAANATEYRWKVDGTIQVGATTDEFVYTPAVNGTYSIVCEARNSFNETDEWIASSPISLVVTSLYGELIKATLLGGSSANMSGLIGGTFDSNLGSGKYKIDKNVYAGIQLAAGTTFQEGDTVIITMTTAGSNYPCLFADKDRTNCLYLATEASSDLEYKIVLPAAAEGLNALYLSRGDESDGYKWNPVLSSISVVRPMPEKSRSAASLSNAKINNVALDEADLSTLQSSHSFASASVYVTAPEVKFFTAVTVTYEDDSYKVLADSIVVTATENPAGTWKAQAEIEEVTYTITAVKPVSYTITYMDGELELGTEVVEANAHPAGYTAYQNPQLASFDGWYSDEGLNTAVADMSAETISADVTYYAKYIKQYATSINIEKYALRSGKDSTLTVALIAQMGTQKYASNFKYDKDDCEIDALNDSKTNRNYAYLGLKVKKAGTMFNFRLAKNNTVKVKFGNVGKTPLVSINGGDYSDMSIDDHVYTYTADVDALVSIKTADGSAVVFQQFAIGEDLEASELTVSLTLGANGYSTYATDYKYTVSGATVYMAALSTNNDNYVILTEVSNAVVPAGEGVILKGEQDSIVTLMASGSAASDFSDNELQAAVVETETPAHAYILATVDDVTAFHPYTGDAIPAHKAYLLINGTGAPVRIAFAENGATSIEELGASDEVVKFMENGKLFIIRNGVVYDAVGRVVK